MAVADPIEERRLAAAKRFGARGIYKDHAELYDHAREDGVEAVLTGNRALIRSDYADALKTHKMVYAANESMESGQVIYFEGERKL